MQGFEDFKKNVLPDYPPEKVSRLTGLPRETLEAMAKAYGKARAPFIRLGTGLSRYGNGAMTVRTIVCLPALERRPRPERGAGAWRAPAAEAPLP